MSCIILFVPSGYEIVLIVLVVVLLFGGKKIPELMKGLGKGFKEFKNAKSEFGDITNTFDINAPEQKAKKPTNDQIEPKEKKD